LMYAGSLDQIPVQMGWMEQVGSHDEWVVMGFPGPEGEVMLVDGPGIFIAESTPEKQLAAWLFAKHLLTPEVQAKLVQSLFTLPVRETSMDLLGDFVNDYPQWAQALERVDHAYYQPISEEWGFGRWVLQDAILRLFAAEEEQVTSILAQLDETILELDGDIYDE
jgi:ABC-type glycerol-3-phosphate transport system substrate-binding protein